MEENGRLGYVLTGVGQVRLVMSRRHGPRGPSPRSHLLSFAFETAQGFLVRSRSSLDYHINRSLYNFYRHASPIFLPSFVPCFVRPFPCKQPHSMQQAIRDLIRIKIFNDNFFLCLFVFCVISCLNRGHSNSIQILVEVSEKNVQKIYVASLEIKSRRLG